MNTPIILVPGFWLGAWAWDEVVAALAADGHHDVTALTLPGLDSVDADRSEITLEDHVRAICDAVTAHDEPVVLVVHSGTGTSGYAATDRVAERVAHMVYVDTGAGVSAMSPDQAEDLPLPSAEDLRAEENLDGLSEEHLARFRARAVPEPAGVLREAPRLENDARHAVPSTVIATSYPAEGYQKGVEEGWGFLAGLADLDDLTWVELPTSHWPMWSRTEELAQVIGDIAGSAAGT